MHRLTPLIAAVIAACVLPLSAWCQSVLPTAHATPPAPGVATSVPANTSVNAIWVGDWRVVDFNVPPTNKLLSTHRHAASAQVTALLAAAECPMTYDGLLTQADIIRRIEERERFQMDAANWPTGTDPAQFVGLKKEFAQALRITRGLPPDSYRRVRVACLGLPVADDRYYILNDGRRLFEFRFPDHGLSVSVTLYERAR